MGSPAPVIDAFVDALDPGEIGFGGVEPAATGRPSHQSAALLKLYILRPIEPHRVQPLSRVRGRIGDILFPDGLLPPVATTRAGST